jgi:hypothetical protein
MRNPE